MQLLNKDKIEEDLILIGGGHSHLKVIMNFIKKPINHIRLTLITNTLNLPYSGMLPGFIEGMYSWRDINIDLYKLCLMGNIRFILDEVKNINGFKKIIILKNRPPIEFDYLSINSGINNNFSNIVGAKKFSIPLKPFSKIKFKFLNKAKKIKNIAVIGGGAAGIEVSLAIKKRLKNDNVNVLIFTGEKGLIPNFNKIAKNLAKRELEKSNIKIIYNDPVIIIQKDFLITKNNLKFKADKFILATNGKPPKWLIKTDLKLSENGFIKTNTKFQTNFDYIFSSGDIIDFNNLKLSKSGVYAVKSGAILTKNLRSLILKKKLSEFKPQKHVLSLIGLSNNKALATKGFFSSISKLNFKLKKYIDLNFVKSFRINKINNLRIESTESNMICKGCAAKISINVIKNSLPETITYNSNDSSNIKNSNNHVYSVDMINSIVTDPYHLGMISVNHALNDIFASGSKPVSAQMILQLPIGNEKIHKRDIKQIFKGSKKVLDNFSCDLVGGHTMIGEDPNPVIGFSVIGKKNMIQKKKIIKNGDLLFLTGKIGSGLIFAGINSNAIDSFYQLEVLNHMTSVNKLLSKALKDIMPLCCTDITGYGLANHLIHLLNRIKNLHGLSIYVENIPVFEGVKFCLKNNVKSTFFEQNFNYCKNFISYENKFKKIDEIIFDPQTVGGLAFIVPQNKKQETLKVLKHYSIKSSIIGQVDNSKSFITIK